MLGSLRFIDAKIKQSVGDDSKHDAVYSTLAFEAANVESKELEIVFHKECYSKKKRSCSFIHGGVLPNTHNSDISAKPASNHKNMHQNHCKQIRKSFAIAKANKLGFDCTRNFTSTKQSEENTKNSTSKQKTTKVTDFTIFEENTQKTPTLPTSPFATGKQIPQRPALDASLVSSCASQDGC